MGFRVVFGLFLGGGGGGWGFRDEGVWGFWV